MRVVEGGAEVDGGEPFLIFVSGGLHFSFPVIVEVKSSHCVLLHFHFEEFAWPLIKVQPQCLHLLGGVGGYVAQGLPAEVRSPLNG